MAFEIALLLLGVNVPDNIVGQADHLIPRALGHLCKALGLGLVLEGVARKVDACEIDD